MTSKPLSLTTGPVLLARRIISSWNWEAKTTKEDDAMMGGSTKGMLRKFDRLSLACFAILVIFLLFRLPSVVSWGAGPNYKNYSVRTTANITSAYPEVLNATCSAGTGIILTAGSAKNLACLVQLRDFDSGSTITMVNSTFYFYQNASSDPDSHNYHYTNTSCTLNGSSGYLANWTCSFDVWYFANNGTWRLNVTTMDATSQQANSYGNVTLSPLLAINVTDTINFGDLSVTQTSGLVQANVTNMGNVNMNVTVFAHGGSNPVSGAGVAMICENRNISFSNERYSSNSLATYDTMTPINGNAAHIPGLTVRKQVEDGILVTNSTYWALHVNVTDNPYGVCNGTVVFSAELP
jgi:hypothetical protein